MSDKPKGDTLASLNTLRSGYIAARDNAAGRDHYSRGLCKGFDMAIQAVDDEIERLAADDRMLVATEQLEDAVADVEAAKKGEK